MSALQTIVALMLALAVLLGSLRLLWRAADATRWRLGLRLLLQPIAAGLLYLTLFPPLIEHDSASGAPLSVLGADWQQAIDAAQVDRTTLDPARTIALPEAREADGFERAADLAGALRRHPLHQGLRFIGTGLTMRDLEAARGRLLEFLPAPIADGLAELHGPAQLRPGQQAVIEGRLQAAALIERASITLLDAAGQLLDRRAVAADGSFRLHVVARGAGIEPLQLQLTDANEQPLDSATLLLDVVAADRPRLLLLGGAPGAELKYLRRWALDAGIELVSRIELSERIPQRRGDAALDADALQQFDAVIIDERAWQGLGRAQQAAVLDAVEAGLGLLLRQTADPGTVEPGTAGRDALRTLGFDVEPSDLPREVRLASLVGNETAADSPHAPGETVPLLSRRPLSVSAADASALLRDDSGEPLALWRPYGHGRIALWWLGDSFRLVLAGHGATHGTLWSDALGLIARPAGNAPPSVEPSAIYRDQRMTICQLSDGARIITPDRAQQPLAIDPERGCAAFWPGTDGVHRIEASAAPSRSFLVRSSDDAPTLAAHQQRRATAALLAEPLRADPSVATTPRPGSPWPWFLGWLLAFALLAAIERRDDTTRS
jgi:hypothetical protein